MYRRLPAISRLAASFVFAALCVAGIPARAQQTDQQPGQKAKANDNPFAGLEDKKLMVFAGAWQEDVRYAGDPVDSPSGKGRWIARPAFGLYLFIGYEGAGPEGDSHAHGVLAYDHEDRVYKLWWFDDAGGIGEYSGNWKDENTLVLEHKKTSGGRPFRERITYKRVSDDEVHTRIEQAWGNEAYKVYLDAVARVRAETDGAGVDVLLEMSGNPAAIRQGFQVLRPGGRASLLGIPAEPVTLDLLEDVIFKGATVQGIYGRRMFETWLQMSALLRDGRLNLEPLFKERLRLEEYAQAFRLLEQGEAGKVLLIPNGAE